MSPSSLDRSKQILKTLVPAGLTAACVVLAMPPYDWWPLAMVGFAPFYLVARKLSPGRAAGLAWLMALAGNLVAQTWWVPLAAGYAHTSHLFAVGLLVGLCAYQALLFAAWAWLCRWLERRWHLSWIISAPLCLALLENAMPFFFKYYLALSVWRAWPLTQVAELGGPPAVSALIVLCNITLAEIMLTLGQRRSPGRLTWASALTFLVILGLGVWRAGQVDVARTQAPHLTVGILQPNFGITTATERERRGALYQATLRRGTVELGQKGAELVIWSESSWPYLFDRTLQREFPPGHPWELRPGYTGRLLAGMLTHNFGTGSDIYNSAVLFSASGQIMGRYDKNHLVPFAEHIPFADRFPEQAETLRKQLHDFPQITPGAEQTVLVDGDLRIGPMICSEDIEPDHVNQLARLNPNLLVALISDGWFGDSAAPRQHLGLASFRAIELRRDFVRATNTGVTAIIDAVGRVRLEGPLYGLPVDQPREETTLLVGQVALLEIPAAAPATAPYFSYACWLALLIGLIAQSIANRRQMTKARKSRQR